MTAQELKNAMEQAAERYDKNEAVELFAKRVARISMEAYKMMEMKANEAWSTSDEQTHDEWCYEYFGQLLKAMENAEQAVRARRQYEIAIGIANKAINALVFE